MSRRLSQISTSHPVFEEDQVLTHRQLNDAIGYLDMQERLARIELAGVGIVCGLRVSLASDVVTLTKGIGVTTDGDLVRVEGTEKLTAFAPYRDVVPQAEGEGTEAPKGWFGSEAFELLRRPEDNPRGAKLSEFGAKTKHSLANMAVVLHVESRITDPDLCSGTDCDNLGQIASHEVKILLVDKYEADKRKETVATPDATARKLLGITAERALLPGVVTPTTLYTQYQTRCASIVEKLGRAFKKLSEVRAEPGQAILDDLFPSDPTPDWKEALGRYLTASASSGGGILYFHDFLKDVVETYEAFRDALLGETSACRIDFMEFPKYLLLGRLDPAANPSTTRTGFYPSCTTGALRGRVDRARFLAAKLDAMIKGFSGTTPAGTIHITPSAGEDRSLEERAMPFYYPASLHELWSHELARKGRSAWVYSYHAPTYGAQGAAASPLESPIGRFSFFRVEGHVGMDVEAAVANIEKKIQDYDLPFVVRAVALDSDRTKIWKRPLPRYTDLHQLHRLVRHGLAEQIEAAADFGERLETNVKEVVDQRRIVDDAAGVTLRKVAGEKRQTMAGSAAKASAKLRQTYSNYARSSSWKEEVDSITVAASELKHGLRDIAKTEFVTPIDTLIGSVHVQWMDWLDELVKENEDKADDKVLFKTFLADHPGLEHAGGAPRGGTLVLAYDASRKVVADFMLPYFCPEPEERAPEPPPKPRRPLPERPWLVYEKAITLDVPVVTRVERAREELRKENLLKAREVEEKVDLKLGEQGKTLDVLRAETQSKLLDYGRETANKLLEYTNQTHTKLQDFTAQTFNKLGDYRSEVDLKLRDFRSETTRDINEKVNLSKGAIDVFDRAVGIAKGGAGIEKAVLRAGSSVDIGVDDELLGLHLEELSTNTGRAKSVKEKLLDPDVSAVERAALERLLDRVEGDIAKGAADCATYLRDKALPLTKGTDGMVAMKVIAESVEQLQGERAVAAAKAGLDETGARAPDAMKSVLGTIACRIKARG
ncbi:hypothetical protein [Polyangium sp. y55x31]|uniref:hypothetical protein n=1 Tax=Polyangium sp. y55x31 TaxID=3042688 RepID=UPI002482B959|nr:hypothetical protein [Polyangium sp. y55x31]MDI1478918.1 hypothetical protein [Polyangium sp. y55x31]